MKTDPNTPAYPVPGQFTGGDGQWSEPADPGLTKREYFAIRFAAAIVAHQQNGSCEMTDRESLSSCAVECADALIAELNKEPEDGA